MPKPNLQRSEMPIITDNDSPPSVADLLRDAAYAVSKELEFLQSLNTRKAVEEFAALYNVRPVELWYFYNYGEHEAERLFRVSRPSLAHKDTEQGDNPAREW